MNLRLRLNIIVTLILLVMLLIGSYAAINNARENVQAEVASTALLTLNMFDIRNAHFSLDNTLPPLNLSSYKSIFELKKLKNIRHVNVDFFDADGNLQDTNRNLYLEYKEVPLWFTNTMDSVTGEIPPTIRKVFFGGAVIGKLVITPEPYYEILEVWLETKTMLWVLFLFLIVVNTIIYIAVGRALQPIAVITEGLTEIESGNLTMRLPKFPLPELSQISDKFNVMAETLETSIAKNHHLTQQIISLQEDERKSIARELHDEVGQHLTAINVDAAAIIQANNWEHVKESAEAISSVVQQMMDMIHSMLERLRPGDIEILGLDVALLDLVQSWKKRNKEVECDFFCENGFVNLSYPVLITIYRVIQECLTNISKHAQASWIQIMCLRNGSKIYIQIADNGIGFDKNDDCEGFGLAGIQERVEVLSGHFELVTSQQKGVRIQIRLPFETGEKR